MTAKLIITIVIVLSAILCFGWVIGCLLFALRESPRDKRTSRHD